MSRTETTHRTLFTHYALNSTEREAAAKHWVMLATEEEKRLAWDRTYLPAVAASKAQLYRETAAKIRAGT